MLLNVAMKQGETGLVRSEIDARASVIGHDDSVFDDAGGLDAIDLSEFELMTMQMHGMGVVGAVAEDEAVPRPLLEAELLLVRVWFAIYQPGIEFTRAAGDLFEDHVKGVLGRTGWLGTFSGAEDRIVPA